MILPFPIKLKEKLTIFFVILFLFVSVYFYLNYLQQSYNSAQWSGERCFSELTSVKYQLNVVTEYKNRIDKLLTDTQKAHETEKEKYKDIMDSCVAMKQQTAICQVLEMKQNKVTNKIAVDSLYAFEGRYRDFPDKTPFGSQFEDLQIECKKVREDYNKVIKELEKLKSTG